MTSFAGRFFAAKPLRAGVGGDATAANPYKVTSLTKGTIEIAVLTSKTTGFPVWAYARETRETAFTFEIWLYLAQPGIPIYSVNAGKWTTVSRYVSTFTAEEADAELISTVDVSHGGVLRSGDKLFVDDALGISEVELTFSWTELMGTPEGGEDTSYVNVSAAKGEAKTAFTPYSIYESLKGSSLGLTNSESKSLPAPPTNALPPTKKATVIAPAPKPFPTGKWLVGGTIMGGLLWALGRRP